MKRVGGESVKGEKHYARLKTKNTESTEVPGLKVKLSGKRVRRKRISSSADTGKLSRVMSPLDAERKNRELYTNLGLVSSASRRQAARSKRLKARRTIALSPAPAPLTAPKTGAARVFGEIKKGILEHLKRLDYLMLFSIIVVAVFGVLAVHSATLTEAAHRRFDLLQIGGFFIGVFLIVIVPFFDYGEIAKRTKFLFLMNVVILVFTLIFGESVTGETNRNWVDIFGVTKIQPAEFAKVLFILSLSSHLERVRERLNRPRTLLGVLLHGGVIIGLVLAEQDWGNALVFFAIFAAMLFAAKIDIRYILGSLALAVISFPLIWDNLDNFRKKRVLIGFNPDLDPLGTGHQVIRSRNAIASGGLFGQGYMQGSTIQQKGALYAKQTDMIFAVIGQELGFVGCAVLILSFMFMVYRIIRTAGTSKDYAGTYICAGVAGMLVFQFIINVGMALGLTPVVGITLPLVSYGTSSLLSTYAALALVMAVYANSKNYSYRSM